MCFASRAPKYYLFRDLVASRTDNGVIYATGYSSEVLDYMWAKYSSALNDKLRSISGFIGVPHQLRKAYWFLALVYIHHYPRWNRFISTVLHTPITGSISCQKFYSRIVPILCSFSQVVDEIQWEDRLHPLNHGSHMFKDRFTTIFDGTNIDVSNVRTDRNLQRVLFNGSKYNHCCVKIMIGITFQGTIVHYTGPHIGTMHDEKILEAYPPAFEPWEWGLGDGAFKSNHHILVKYQQPANGILTADQVAMNTIFNYWRLRVEHIIGEVNRHDMFDGVFRGSYILLKSALDLTVHMTQAKIKFSLPRYRTCGPWGHEPDAYKNKKAKN